ncbi:hypothetical protein Acr_07g0016450 [Actinidia rufa]|uniref:Uncharacterized protein n=1 Tax=Actinidia rufa TaxID=165716 RepID=A0A7J0EZT0_9ERIC|nr:hypothetical protein Acr_07g0016450 [Actinidia rufa]
MKHRNSGHHAKHRHGIDTAENNPVRLETHEMMPHKLIDAPPYADIYLTSHGFEAIRPEAHKKVKEVLVDYDPCTTEYPKYCNEKVYEEDIDAEAEKFIKHKHKKFQLSKWMSMNGG